MKIVIAAFLFLFVSQISLAASVRVDCFMDKRITATNSDTASRLCSDVENEKDISSVIKCYTDSRLGRATPEISSLLCSKVKSDEDIEKVVDCYLDRRLSFVGGQNAAILCR